MADKEKKAVDEQEIKKKLEQAKKKKAFLKLIWKGKEITGRPLDYSLEDGFVIKLPSGYNIGISFSSVEGIEVIEKPEKKEEPTHLSLSKEEIEFLYPKSKGKEKKKKRVVVLGCGGTISSAVDYETGAVKPRLSPGFISSAYPEVEEIAVIETKELFSIFSEEIGIYHWKEIAKEAYSYLKEGKPVVVLHGTDTLSYTASALAFSIQSLNQPVILTGSQRSSDRPSSDAKLNFLNSLYAATKNVGEVAVVMHSSVNDDFSFLHRGVKVRKMHTSRRDAFKSIGIKPLAKVDYRKGIFERIERNYPLKETSRLSALENDFEEDVAMLYIHPGIKPSLISKLSEYKGVVLVATGLGHVPLGISHSTAYSILKELQGLIESGVAVAITSQAIYGRINLSVYAVGRKLLELGVIGDKLDLLPEVAFVKLSWALAKEKKIEKVKQLMEKNLVGEISPTSAL